jgi:predicted nucleotidyltransferase
MVNIQNILEKVKNTESPLRRQLLMVALITMLLEEKGKSLPIIIGGCALSYYSREVYFTSDVDLACADREALNTVLTDIGFEKRGRYWVNEGLKMAIEAPASTLIGEDSPIEIVEVGEGLQCRIIGIEDLIIDRMNAFKHWKSEMDGEMVELLVQRYRNELDWAYLERKAALPENDILSEILELKQRTGNEE